MLPIKKNYLTQHHFRVVSCYFGATLSTLVANTTCTCASQLFAHEFATHKMTPTS